MKRKKELEIHKQNQDDSSNATLGVIIGGFGLIFGFILLFTIPQFGLIVLSLSVFPICEIFRGIISIRRRKIINDISYTKSKDLKAEVEQYDEKLKLIKKIKIIGIIVSILFVVIVIMRNSQI